MSRIDSALFVDIKYLKGVGEKRAKALAKLGIFTVGDLLNYYPRNYIDATNPQSLLETTPGELSVLRLTIKKIRPMQRVRAGMSLVKVDCYDDTTTAVITFFNNNYVSSLLNEGEEYLFYARVNGGMLKKEIISPIILGKGNFSGLIPVYSLTAGISSKMLGQYTKNALDLALENIPEVIPKDIRARHKLCHIQYALDNIHHPKDRFALETATRRLVFEELFMLSLSLCLIRQTDARQRLPSMKTHSLEEFFSSLPFAPTNAQKAAIDDSINDMCSGRVMNRLIQGDVGSGKTVVAAAAMYFAFKNNFQSAMMAPTEILAAQHYQTLKKMLEPLGASVKLLTGAMPAKEKRTVLNSLKDGSVDICVGTHALISKNVEFNHLQLVITDEQHRFGVRQRKALGEKGGAAHLLVMSATPIPRTLALIIYGDLDISVINEMPVGRTKIDTFRIDSPRRERAYSFIKSFLDKGLRAYIVCPLVNEGDEDSSLLNASDYAKKLKEGFFKDYNIGLLHGKMKPLDKEMVMADFKSGRLDILVATTVIEVGVDVPEAVVILIENAERFGLSQLHQLRGRVGRGKEKSYCILLSDTKNHDTLSRLGVMCRTSDGFEIANEDLKQRGAGDFLGNRQHGLPHMRIADLSNDTELLNLARSEATALLETDPNLTAKEHTLLKQAVDRLISEVGENPN